MSVLLQNIIISTVAGVFYFLIPNIFAKKSKKHLILQSVILIIFNITLNFIGLTVLGKSMMIFVAIIILVANISVLSSKTVLGIISTTFIIIIAIAVFDTLIGLSLMYYGIEVEEIQNDFLINLSVTLLMLILVYTAIKMFYEKKLKGIMSLTGFTKDQKVSIALFFIMTGIILMFNTYLFTANRSFVQKENVLAMIILYFLYLLVIIRFISTNRNLTNKTEEYERLKFYTSLIEDLTDESNKFRHDYNNVMISFMGYINSKDYDGLDQYFKQLIEVNDKLSSHNLGALKGILDSGIKGLLTMKFNQIMTENIVFDLEVHEKIEFSIGMLDLSRILGILLDNAKEAALSSNIKSIKVGILNEDNQVTIFIANTFKEAPKIAEIFNKGVSSKGDNRGYGLSNVKEILSTKYPDVSLNAYIRDGYFVQEILF